uniref:N-acetyltransferase domain-containing protein n=1 Tax=Heterorhabditis bacteriophora TaxID=37862 RepID=A0A1I7X0Z4_HETBA
MTCRTDINDGLAGNRFHLRVRKDVYSLRATTTYLSTFTQDFISTMIRKHPALFKYIIYVFLPNIPNISSLQRSSVLVRTAMRVKIRTVPDSQKVDPSKAFDFIPAQKKDFSDIFNLCINGFIDVEPHSKALKLKKDEVSPMFKFIVTKALHYPYSYRINEKGTDNLIGFRLLSIGHRDESLDVVPFELEEPTDKNALMICGSLHNFVGQILERSKKQFWEVVDPNVNKVLRREITFVSPEHQRKGIANYLLHLGLDFEQLKKEGISGITSEASSLANQTLLAKHGYKCMVKPDYKLEMHDGNEGVTVFYKDLKKK